MAVRNMYVRQNVTDMTEDEQKQLRRKKLQKNPDVLFKLYKPIYPPEKDQLHNLLFRPTSDPLLWMQFCRENYDKLSFQWTHKQAHKPVRDVISIMGALEELNTFCASFPTILETLTK